MPTIESPGSGPQGCYTVDDVRTALAGQPGDSIVMTMTVRGKGAAIVMGVEPVLNDRGRIVFYLFTQPIPGA